MNEYKKYKEFFDVHRLKRRIEKLERQLELAQEERNKWREVYEQTLAIAVQATDHE